MSERISNAEMARQYCAKYPRHSQREIARALYKDLPERFPHERAAYKTVQSVVAPWGKGHGNKRAEGYAIKPSGASSAPPPLPESKVKAWEPYQLSGERILILSDIHIPYHDTPSLESALAYGDSYKPSVVLLNGDLCDFYTISRYETNPEMRDLAGEVEAVRQFLAHLRARFPAARIVLKLGNHDERWWSYLWRKAPELLGLDVADFGALIHADAHRVELLGDQRIIRAGHLSILHGHELPKGLTNPVNPARGVFLRAVEIALIGHHHRTSEHTETTMNEKTITCWSTGCLCDLHPEYARINRWNHGFATVDMHGDDFTVRNLRIRNGKIL